MKSNRCISCQNEIEHYPCPHCGFDPAAYHPPEYALTPGYILHGRYLIGRVLGQGGFGITYVGWDLALQVKCAIKEYYPSGQVTRAASGAALDWYATPQAQTLRLSGMDSFLKEARKMAKAATIPQVVSVRDTFAENATAYIVMDFVEGRTLKERLEQEGILSWAEAKKIFFPVMSAMEQVHKAGLVHRDLSPDNLMLLPDGDVKILDLGAAKDLTANQGLSSMQVVKGGFSPIEQYGQAGGSGPWTDVYSMAATIYYSITGKLPTVAVDRLTEDALRWDLPQLAALPKHVLEALKQAMVVLPKDRTQSMGALLSQMQSSSRLKTRKKTEKIHSTGSQPQTTAKVGRSKAILAAAVVTAVLGGLALWLTPDQPSIREPKEETSAPTESVHNHSWAEATVGRPARCEICGRMAGTSLHMPISADETIVALRRDGTVLAQGGMDFDHWLGTIPDWQEVASVKAAYQHVYGIKEDGTVFMTSLRDAGTMEWSDIAKIDSEHAHAAGLRKDGTVITKPYIENMGAAHLDTAGWTDMVDIAAGYGYFDDLRPYTLGLKADGTVVVAAEEDLFPEVKKWTDIVAVLDQGPIVLGLKADGTVLSSVSPLGNDDSGWDAVLKTVGSWRDIAQIDCGCWGVAGLKNDGTAVLATLDDPEWAAKADVSGWTDIVCVAIGDDVYGLKANGTILMEPIKLKQEHDKDIRSWTGIKMPDGPLIPADPRPHVHTWVDASITAPRHCSGCGQMEGMPLHNPIAAGDKISYALQNSWAEGTVVSAGYDIGRSTNTWRGITALAAGDGVAGLKEDGTVLVAGNYGDYTKGKLSKWTDIAAIHAGGWNLFGIKSDGTVVCAGEWSFQRSVSHWTDIVSVATSSGHAIALRRDGTVVSTGNDDFGQCSGVKQWKNMVGIAAGEGISLGLKCDGTVAAIWDNAEGKAAVESWTDIIALAASNNFVVGLRSDGTVVAAGNNEDCQYPVEQWSDVVAIDVSDHVLALKSDGTVLAGGKWLYGQGGIEGTETWTGVPMPG